MTNRISILEAITEAATGLSSSTPRLDCQLILANLLDRNRSWLIAHSDEYLTDSQYSAFQSDVVRCEQGTPVAYILGQQEFWSLPFEVNNAVLIPRPETELLVEEVLSLHPQHPINIADLGTGTGAIAISLALEKPDDTIFAVDKSLSAIRVASANRTNLGATNVRLCVADWLAGFSQESLDVIVTNPPYIAEGDKHLPDLQYEPAEALVSGHDGLDDIRQLITQGLLHLKPGGMIAMEHGYDQQSQVADLMLAAGYRNIVTKQDLAGQPRITLAERP